MISEFKKGDLVRHLLWDDQYGIVISACDEHWRDEYDKMLTVEWITYNKSKTPQYVPPQSIAKADQWHLKKVKDES
jgi:hypothetical protein